MPEKVKLAAALMVSAGGLESIEVFGATVSTVQVNEAGRRVDVPGLVDRPDFEVMGAVGEPRIGLRRGAGGEVGAVDRRHWKEATPEPPASVPEKVKLAAALLVSAGGLESIVVFGAVVSTVQVEAGRASRRRSRPGRSPGLRRYGEPSARPGIGLRRGAGREGGAVERPALEARRRPSRRASVPEKVKLARRSALASRRLESIVVFGAAVSTVQVKVAGVASTFPAWSIARTSKVWEPSASPE